MISSLAGRVPIYKAIVIVFVLLIGCGDSNRMGVPYSNNGDADIDGIEALGSDMDAENQGGEDGDIEVEPDMESDGESPECPNNDPCTHVEWDENRAACISYPLCMEPLRENCLVVDGQAECYCDPGYIDFEGECVADAHTEGNGCDDPIVLSIGSGSVFGSTLEAGNHAEGSCGGIFRDGPDKLYTFRLEETTYASFMMVGYDTILHLRNECTDVESEVMCNDLGQGPAAKIEGILHPGEYYLFADSWHEGGEYELIYEFRSDPCNGDPCPGEPFCHTFDDWSGYECRCSVGMVVHGESCVDDPCEPNPCAEEHRNVCLSELPDDYFCDCDFGYVSDETGNCIMDPEGNDWAFLVFLNADNDLEEHGYLDLEEMAAIGSNSRVHVVVQFDSYSRDEGDTRRLYIGPDGIEEVENIGEADMSDWQCLRDFVIWAIEHYPARRHALVLWDHGDGWKNGGLSGGYKGISRDMHGTPGKMSIAQGELAQALAAIKQSLGDKLDLIGFDACLMGFFEVAAACAPFAETFVASQENEPDDGWDYISILRDLKDHPEMETEELASLIVESYVAQGESFPTLSAVDLSRIDAIYPLLSSLADALAAEPERFERLEILRQSALNFSGQNFSIDLSDMLKLLLEDPESPEAWLVPAAALDEELRHRAVIHHAEQEGWQRAGGLSIYFPSNTGFTDSKYLGEGAVWCDMSSWDEFLQTFTNGPY